jgi:hypothetical protein
MALTAARSELNVALVGENEVSAMLEQAKKQMGELEGKIRSLTGASREQVSAAKATEGGLDGVNGKMKGLAGRAEGLVEGVDKLKGAFEKVVGAAGFIGMAVTGAIAAFNFLKETFGDTEKKTADLQAQFDGARKEADALTSSIHALVAATRQAEAAIGAQNLRVAGLRADLEEARGNVAGATLMRAEQKADSYYEAAEENERRAAEVQQKIDELTGKEAQATAKVTDLVAKQAKIREDAEAKIKKLKAGDAAEAIKLAAKAREIRSQADGEILALRNKAKLNSQNDQALTDAIEKQRRLKAGYEQEATAAREVGEQLSYNTVELERQQRVKTRGGGGGGGGRRVDPAVAAEAKAKEEEARILAERQAERDAWNATYEKALMNQAAKRQVRLEDEAKALRERIKSEIEAIPVGQFAAAHEPVKKELEKQLAAIDELIEGRYKLFEGTTEPTSEQFHTEISRQTEALNELQQAVNGVSDARSKATEEEKKMREEMEKSKLAKPLEDLEKYKAGIGQLTQMAVPAFGEVGTVLGQVTDQLQRYKDGQTSMAMAVTNSASSIAGAIAKQIGGVKAEAAVRAIFETAMGFATLANPLESAGHFTAATMFGLVAGGVLKSGGSPGGQKPAQKPAAATKESNYGGGGGSITNVYNLQTGVVDGQGTARAFRRAEQQARNTGMASAGGW